MIAFYYCKAHAWPEWLTTITLIGAPCALYCLMRFGFGGPNKMRWFDWVAAAGAFLFPPTWVLYGFIMPIALLVDYINSKEDSK